MDDTTNTNMSTDFELEDELETEEGADMSSEDAASGLHFTCPNCGQISQDDVAFLCNTCDSSELVLKDGVYMCPSCLVPGQNFECMSCGSTEVKMQPQE